MNLKLIGGILLVIGTTIGGGMLALPVATAQSGFGGAMLMLFGCWAVMTFCAFLILEVNLWLPADTNLISMAKSTLGKPGEIVAWLSYLLLLYCLLAAYISGGTDVTHSLLLPLGIDLPSWAASLIFVVAFGLIVCQGIRTIDFVNRGLMAAKLVAYVLLVAFITPHINIEKLRYSDHHYLLSMVTVMITSYGFATIVPSLRSYFNSDVQQLRKVVLIGSFIPLICYSVWVASILGEIPLTGKNSLLEILSSGHTTSALTAALNYYLANSLIDKFASVFTSVCVTTSFLGVALCMTDFLADGLRITKEGRGKLALAVATFVPPLAMTLFYPNLFIVCLGYAGILCVILLMLLPVLMTWRGRYMMPLAVDAPYQVIGGKLPLVILGATSIFLIGLGIAQSLNLA